MKNLKIQLKRQGMFIFFLCLMGSLSFGQISIDSTDFPLAGSTRYRITDTLPSTMLYIYPSGGTGLSWDFTGDIDADKQDTINYLDPGSAPLPFASLFPTANYAVQVLPENTSIFVENTGTSHVWLGVSNPAFPVFFTPNREFLTFSMDYNDRDTSNFGSDLQFPFDVTMTSFDSSRVKNETSEFFHYDASGTFVDNESNTLNCLRRAHITISKDSIWGYSGGVAVFVTEAIDTTQGFSFFGENTGIIANVDVDATGNVIHAEFFRGTSITALDEIQQGLDLSVYPNPSNGIVNLDFPQLVHGKLRVSNLQGQHILQTHVNSSSTSIDLRKNRAGVYFYEFISTDQKTKSQGKIILTK